MIMLMLPYVILGAMLAFPILLGLFFRVSASHIFFSVMAGELLARYFAHDAESVLASTVKNDQVTQYGELILLVVPILLTALFLKGTISHGKAILHTVPLAITGLVFAVFSIPLLSTELQDSLRSIPVGNYVFDLSNAVIGIVVGAQLVTLWILSRSEATKKKKHKH